METIEIVFVVIGVVGIAYCVYQSVCEEMGQRRAMTRLLEELKGQDL